MEPQMRATSMPTTSMTARMPIWSTLEYRLVEVGWMPNALRGNERQLFCRLSVSYWRWLRGSTTSTHPNWANRSRAIAIAVVRLETY
jgi:hypothetical protein